MGIKNVLAPFFHKLPFRELGAPFKMLSAKWANRSFRLPVFQSSESGQGSLKILHGIPLVILQGTPYEIGFQHGSLLKDQISALFQSYLGRFIYSFSYELKLAKRMESFIPLNYREEIRGLAEASDLSYDEVLVMTCFLDLHKVAACSTLVVHDQSSENGEILFGRNLDFPALGVANQAHVIFAIKPEKGLPFVSIGWPGLIGSLSGMNDQGLSMAMMLVYGHTRSDHLQGIPFPLCYRSLLEECRTVPEAISQLKKQDYAVCNNIMLADAGRDAALVEAHTQSFDVLKDQSDFPVLRCTNHFRMGRKKWAFALNAFSSYLRLLRLNGMAQKKEAFRPGSIKEALRKVAMSGINLQRMIFYPERQEFEVAFQQPKKKTYEYHYFKRQELWENH